MEGNAKVLLVLLLVVVVQVGGNMQGMVAAVRGSGLEGEVPVSWTKCLPGLRSYEGSIQYDDKGVGRVWSNAPFALKYNDELNPDSWVVVLIPWKMHRTLDQNHVRTIIRSQTVASLNELHSLGGIIKFVESMETKGIQADEFYEEAYTSGDTSIVNGCTVLVRVKKEEYPLFGPYETFCTKYGWDYPQYHGLVAKMIDYENKRIPLLDRDEWDSINKWVVTLQERQGLQVDPAQQPQQHQFPDVTLKEPQRLQFHPFQQPQQNLFFHDPELRRQEEIHHQKLLHENAFHSEQLRHEMELHDEERRQKKKLQKQLRKVKLDYEKEKRKQQLEQKKERHKQWMRHRDEKHAKQLQTPAAPTTEEAH